MNICMPCQKKIIKYFSKSWWCIKWNHWGCSLMKKNHLKTSLRMIASRNHSFWAIGKEDISEYQNKQGWALKSSKLTSNPFTLTQRNKSGPVLNFWRIINSSFSKSSTFLENNSLLFQSNFAWNGSRLYILSIDSIDLCFFWSFLILFFFKIPELNSWVSFTIT